MTPALPHNAPTISALPNGWQQVSFTLNIPMTLAVGTRLRMGDAYLAPWRVTQTQIDCLIQPHTPVPSLSQPIILEQHGQALPTLHANQPLLITGTQLGIADALLAASHVKHYASQTLVLLDSDDQFPCLIKPARFMVNTLPDLIATCPLLEDWGFANRLVSRQPLPGCFDGRLHSLIQQQHLQDDYQWWAFPHLRQDNT